MSLVWRGARRAYVCAAVAVASGCSNGEGLRAAATCDLTLPLAITAERRDSLRATDDRMRPDAQWAVLARTVPGGFAGAYFDYAPLDRRGRPVRRQSVVVRLTRPDERSEALRALLPRLSSTFGGLLIDSADVMVVPARWDFAQLDEWRRYLDFRVGIPELHSLSTDATGNRILYGVSSVEARVALERRLRELRVPCGLVTVEVRPTPRTM